jgi:hypothetical protein
MPRRLIVKSPLVPAKAGSDSSGEAHFYRRVAPLLGARYDRLIRGS